MTDLPKKELKIALCLSGQPRSYIGGYEYHKKNLLDKHNVDVFIHTWKDSFLYDIETLYKPVALKLDEPLNATYINSKYTKVANPQFPAFNTYSMWYSVFEANELRKLYTLRKGIEYDIVIRSRFDYALNRELDFDVVENHTLYVPQDRMTPAHDFCSDMFAYGRPDVMDCYSNTFTNIDYFYSFGMTMNGEDMLSNQLYMSNLVGVNMVYVDMCNPFPPGKYNGNWHAIIRDDFNKWNVNR